MTTEIKASKRAGTGSVVRMLRWLSEEQARHEEAAERTNVELAMMLLEMDETEGWRTAGYRSFAACVKEVTGLTASHYPRLLAFARTLRDLEGDLAGRKVTEYALRPLADLEPGEKRAVFHAAEEDKPSADVLRKARERYFVALGKPEKATMPKSL